MHLSLAAGEDDDFDGAEEEDCEGEEEELGVVDEDGELVGEEAEVCL